jgi:RHS repeat-associated protein
VSSSTITLNGIQILGPDNFNQKVSFLEVPISLQALNTLSVEVRGKPGGAMIIKVFPFLVIDTPAAGQALSVITTSVTGHLYSEATSISVNGVSGTITGTMFLVNGAPLVEGNNVLTATAVRPGGFTGQTSITVTRDMTPPVISLTSPQDGETVSMPTIDIVGSVDDPLAVVFVNGSAVVLTGASFAARGISLQVGLNSITIEARDILGNRSTTILRLNYAPPAPTAIFAAEPTQVQEGSNSTLQWTTTGATAVSVTPGFGAVSTSGTQLVSPSTTTTYTLTATGPGGTITKDATVTVTYPPPLVTLSASPGTIFGGSSTTLSWSTVNASACSVEPSIGAVPMSGSSSVSPANSTTYSIICSGSGGTATASTMVTVNYLPPTANLSATPTSILEGMSSTLSWSSSHAQTCSIDSGIGSVPCSGSVSVVPSATSTYTLTATGQGGTITSQTTVNVTYPVPTVTLGVSPESILLGGSSSLSWSSTNATTVSIEPGLGTVSLSGSASVSPATSTSYTVMATGPGGTATAQVTVTVTYPAPTASIVAAPTSVLLGTASTLTWTTTGAQICSIDHGIGAVPCNSSQAVIPDAMTTYTLTAIGPGGTATAITVVEVAPAGIHADMSVASVDIAVGETTTLSWSTNAASDVIIEPGIGRVAASGTREISPTATQRYVLTAVGIAGVARAEAIVSVHGTPVALSEGSFGLDYADLMPADATIAAYDEKRFAIATGVVQGHAGEPLAGVGVAVLNRPELGTAFTDADGRYSLPVEGGDVLTLVFSKHGLLNAHRQVRVDWNTVAIADTVILIPVDDSATTIVPDGDPSHVFVHHSSEVTTERGTRSATMVLTGDTRVYAQTGAGEVELPSFELRATEFDKPEAMPAHLPPSSAFTYCVNLTASGLENVRFSKPVTVYVDNFLGFDVGTDVPAGSYDYRMATWMPSEDGKVVRLLDLDGDGIVDALDADGDGLADDLDGDGSYSDEVLGLEDAGRFTPGATFWRVNISHLTPWDFNWPWGFGADDILPNPKSGPFTDGKRNCDQSVDAGSYAECQGRVLHENLPIPGTDLSLHYASDRTAGYETVIVVPASGATVPASLKQIIVKVKIAGREMETTLPPTSKQVATFSWDGKDYRGRQMAGTIPAEVKIGFVYKAVYYSTRGGYFKSFARAGGSGAAMATAIQTQGLIISWKHTDILVRRDGLHAGELGNGWTLTAHHQISSSDPTMVYKGDGSVLGRGTLILSKVESSLNGAPDGYHGNCNIQLNSSYCWPSDLTSDAAGNLYVADTWRHCIRKINRDGTVTTIAGRENIYGYSGDGGLASQALLSQPTSIASDPAGNLYVSDLGNRRVRKIDTSGVITTVVGNGTCYGTEENIPAVQAAYCPNGPSGTLAADAWGNLYVADRVNQVVRRVRPDGIIENLLQSPAIYDPTAVAVDTQGNLYIGSGKGSFVYRYSTAGELTPFAGIFSRWDHDGDGGPALSAKLDAPKFLHVDKGGNVYIVGLYWVRKVDTDGIITTVTSDDPLAVDTGDGTPAATAKIAQPGGLTTTGYGTLFIASIYNNAIYKVYLPGVSEAAAGSPDIRYADENGLGYVFSPSGKHQTTVDLRTGVPLRSFGYGPTGLEVTSDRFGNTLRIERDGVGRPTAIVAPDGQVTELDVDAAGNLARVIYPDGTIQAMAYDARGLLTDEWDPRGNHSHHEFDLSGRVLNTLDLGGGQRTWTRAFDYLGNISTSLQAPEGDLSLYAEKKAYSTGYTSTRTAPDGSVSTYYQSSDELSERETPPWGGSLTYGYTADRQTEARFLKESVLSTPAALTLRRAFGRTYRDADADGFMETVTDTTTVNGNLWQSVDSVRSGTRTETSPAGRVTILTYHPESLLTERVQVSWLFSTDFTHDSRGRLTSVTVGGRTSSFAYDLNGNPDYLVTPDGKTYDYTYDLMGRLRSEVRPDGTTVEYEYDENGNLSVLTNPNLVGYGFGYTANNQRQVLNQPLSGSLLYQYDKARRLLSVSLPSGRTIQNTYQRGNLVSVGSVEGTTSYSYASGGRLASALRNGEGFSLTYDGPLVTNDTRSGTLGKNIAYAYNNDLAVTSLSYAGTIVALGYDADGLLSSAGGFVIPRNAQNGLPVGLSGQGLAQTRTFNGYAELDGVVSSVAGIPAYAWSVTARDSAGRITRREEQLGGSTTVLEYVYNAVGRLMSVRKDGALVESYSYDANGNRLEEINTLRGITGQSCAYSAEDHVISVGTDSYVFDVDGYLQSRTTSEGTTHYQYSTRGELLRVDKPDGTILNYVHDPFGRRIAKQVNGTIIEKYLWAGQTTLLAVYDGNNNLLQRYAYADARMPVSMTAGGATYFLLTDQVGSLRAVADSTGTIVKRIDYDSFGNIIADTNPAFSVPFGFAGGLHDRDTGLVRFGYRDYSPELGRFVAKDPIDFAGGDTNLYAYVMNDPVNLVDPDGLVAWHGNWGGPNWTGGYPKSWDQLTPKERFLAMNDKGRTPVDAQDILYQTHDISYGDCRESCANDRDSCDCERKCFNKADFKLASGLRHIGIDVPSWLKAWVTTPVFYIQPAFRNRGFDGDGKYSQFKWEF